MPLPSVKSTRSLNSPKVTATSEPLSTQSPTWSSSLFSRKTWTLSRILWLGGITLCVVTVLGVMDAKVGISVGTQVENDVRTILKANVSAVRSWFRAQETIVKVLAERKSIEEAAADLLSRRPLPLAHKKVRDILEPLCAGDPNYTTYMILALDGRILTASDTDKHLIDRMVGPRYQVIRKELENGKTAVTAPMFGHLPAHKAREKDFKAAGSFFAMAPIYDQNRKVVACLAVGIRPEIEFSKILRTGEIGRTGQTVAFNEEGYLLSEVRDVKRLVDAGLMESTESPVLRVRLLDPGIPLVWAGPKKRPLHLQPPQPTEMIKSATSKKARGKVITNTQGYRNHLGVKVVGAWIWLPEYNFGMATEINKPEAFERHMTVRIVIWVLGGVTAIAVLTVAITSFVMAGLRKQIGKADKEVSELGQYTLVHKIGEGGMGAVYKAQHEMLQRPTAVKVLRQENCSESDLARFEREVQLTSRLSHPNTIAVYDFGRTPDDLFYYAMEYLVGVTLEKFVEKVGPLPEARAIYILGQICLSLEEAHEMGLVHRDIKPANIMICKHGGQYDVVKVLDFGLVKDVTEEQAGTTTHNYILGTPLYISPEAITNPEVVEPARDIYAVGAVAYYLLTGKPVFEGINPMQIFQKHMDSPPRPPSEVLGWDIDADLEDIILRCLAKKPYERPVTVGELWTAFSECRSAGRWNRNKAKDWWVNHAEWFELPELFVPEGKPTMQIGRPK
ncbi:MAG: serine/threonine protein kinase [Gemmataceae bacterium]